MSSHRVGGFLKEAFDKDVTPDLTQSFYNLRESVRTCKAIFSDLFHEINQLEADFFTLVGEKIGDLTVLGRCDKEITRDGFTTYIPAWVCRCKCGTLITVKHEQLIDETKTNCGGCK